MEQRYNEEYYWDQRYLYNEKSKLRLAVPHSALAEHISMISPTPNQFLNQSSTIFIPFCGKSLDMAYLCDLGYKVIGCEKDLATVEDVFKDLGADPLISKHKQGSQEIAIYQKNKLKIYVCDFFDLQKIEKVDGVFDKAVLVCLPAELRKSYCEHMAYVTNKAPQLLIAFERARFNNDLNSVPMKLLNEYYGDKYSVESLSRRLSDIDPTVIEVCYLLIPIVN